MLKSLASTISKHAGHVVIGAILAHVTGLTALLAAYVPAGIFSALASVGITINASVLATAIATGVTNYIEKYATGGK